MKKLILVYLLLVIQTVWAQDISILAKITKDSVAIKWLPSNFNQFRTILQGAKVYRIESAEVSNPSVLDFSQGKVHKIDSTILRYKSLNSSLPEDDKFITLLSPYYEGATDPEEQNFAFGTAVIENVINSRFQYVVGNIFVDKDFVKGKSYYYKIELSNKSTVYKFVNTNDYTKFPEIEDFNLILDLKKSVEATWNYQKIKRDVFGFIIDHSIDDTLHSTNLLSEPYLPFKSSFEKDDKKGMIRDDKALQGHFHFYRVRGLDPFGIPSITSEWKKIYVPLLIDAWVQIDTIIAKKEERIINAHIFSDGKPTNIENITLLRSTEKDTNYQVIESRIYNDSLPTFSITGKLSDDHYYYKIIAFNNDDTVSSLPYYFFTLDQQPPGIPRQVGGTVDSSGVVTLKWIAPEDDDIQGYRVFRGNAKDEEFVEQTKKLSNVTVFYDTIRLDNLTSEIYYFVKAVDDNYNNSLMSDTVLLIKPDTIPPVSAVLVDVISIDTSLIIKWVNSNSTDLKYSKLIKFYGSKVDTIFSWIDTASSFIDHDLTPGNEYSYKIKVFDKSLNSNETKVIMRFYEPGYRIALAGVEAKVDKVNRGIILKWNKPTEKVFSYVIYRAKSGEKLLPLKTINNDSSTTYLDKKVAINNKYQYSIKYVTENGIHSKPVLLEVIYQ